MDDSDRFLRSCQVQDAVAAGQYGLVVRLARRTRGLTQQALGQRCGYSAATISRFETGARPLVDIETLRAFARELALPVSVFGLAPPPLPPSVRRPAGASSQSAGPSLTRVGSVRARTRAEDGSDESVRRRELLTGAAGVAGAAVAGLPLTAADGGRPDSAVALVESLLLAEVSGAAPVPLGQVRASLAAARGAFEGCRYRELAGRLPGLARAAHASRDAATGRTRERLSVALAGTYALASGLAVKLNEDGMAWVAADRSLAAARETADAATIAVASRAVAIAMRRLGHYDGATRLLTATALDLGADRGNQPPEVLAAYGSLLCTAAYASAQNAKRGQALDLIGEAEQAAARMGQVPTSGLVFGAASVAVYRIGVHTALGEPGVALDHARRVDQHLLPTPERHARFCIDTARAWEQHGRRDRAYETLRVAERHAPEEIRRPSVRTLISGMLYAPGTPPAGLRSLAARAGAITLMWPG